MMKTYKITVIFISVLFWISCDTDQLEQNNPTQLSPETFFKNEAQVRASVNAVYASLQTIGSYSRNYYYMMDNMGHDNTANIQQEANKIIFLDFSFDASSELVRAFWDSEFRGVNKANFVIDNADRINEIPNSLLSQEMKDKYIGEAKFLRALYYFNLVTRFGDVPLITTIPEGGQGLPRTASEEVYAQIIADLKDASQTLLPKTEEENGRATRGAAYAFLGKVYLYQENYAEAMNAFENVYGKYALAENYFDNFKEETEHGPESIFAVEYDESMPNGAFWNSDVNGEGGNESSLRGQSYGMFDWFNAYPSDELRAEFEENDPRFDESFYTVGDTYAGGVITEISLDRPAGWRKYQNYYKRTNENLQSGINMNVIRYADVLLMMAEASNELRNQAQAIGYINEVRDRVDMPLLQNGLSQDEVFQAIVHERRVELAGEQVRFPDLVRWGLAEQELGKYGYQEGIHNFFPIPEVELNTNDSINSGDQNPGY
ncbi:RagB/SusD family nutrient uptake outer membrane protein [Zunongwangia profunda]|uniref:RagB/SusD domain-containing protein n=2 Tax=Zunongwangia profunda TaxID=398743 RepID=D5BHX8_ZUNPS|nr:RagB/SusD family nutrient uptake outer membrane protein [Zunongwangia profunda]ADF51366.1 RagB/SusD domain-containing protein [Zunongwangia profunda SM-A87]MAS69639.1 RagB/SusD family nutrient uptake outer membrane protein [Zunongwangia sp.]|tara:strand:+ start:2611 stop:4077 length:1467 start_codon:yes stop_codon:yes gene_type:complete